MMRLDKIISTCGFGTRKEAKQMVKANRVSVDGEFARDPGMHIDIDKNTVLLDGKLVIYKPYIYIMLNKPAEVVSATSDKYDKTVVDILPEEYLHYEPAPVGRLDKDTHGLLLMTNDGVLAHKLLSPKKNVPKIYHAEINMEISNEDILAFSGGIVLDDGYRCMSGGLKVLETGEINLVEVTIYEGKFHQVKRMFEALGKKVMYLKRVRFAGLDLDESLKEGESRELTQDEMSIISNIV